VNDLSIQTLVFHLLLLSQRMVKNMNTRNNEVLGLGKRRMFAATAMFLTLGQLCLKADELTVTTANGLGADAYVQGSTLTGNYGDSGVITTRDGLGNAANVYKDYFRFDLQNSGFDLSTATSVTFSFVALTARTGTGFGFYILPDGLPGDASPSTTGWQELGITYENAPGNPASGTATTFITTSPGDENGNYVTSVGTLTLNTTAGGTVTFTSASLLAALQNDTNGFLTIAMLRTDTAGIVQIASKENTGGYQFPTLTINATPVPEPASFCLILLVVAALGFRYFPHRNRARSDAQG
jgi:hypothetical protein